MASMKRFLAGVTAISVLATTAVLGSISSANAAVPTIELQLVRLGQAVQLTDVVLHTNSAEDPRYGGGSAYLYAPYLKPGGGSGTVGDGNLQFVDGEYILVLQSIELPNKNTIVDFNYRLCYESGCTSATISTQLTVRTKLSKPNVSASLKAPGQEAAGYGPDVVCVGEKLQLRGRINAFDVRYFGATLGYSGLPVKVQFKKRNTKKWVTKKIINLSPTSSYPSEGYLQPGGTGSVRLTAKTTGWWRIKFLPATVGQYSIDGTAKMFSMSRVVNCA